MSHGRTFDGTDDVISLAPGNGNFAFGPATFAIILKRNGTTDETPFAGYDGASTLTWYMGIDDSGAGNDLFIDIPDIGFRLAPTTVVTNANNWVLVAITKDAGSATPRFHKYVYDTTTWTHENGTAIASGPATSDRFQVGAGAGDFYQGDILIAGLWNEVLDDATLEGMTDSLSQWEATNPDGLWRFDQDDVGDPVLDLTGGGADQTSITGTAVGTEDLAGFTFDEGGTEFEQSLSGSISPAGAIVQATSKAVSGSITPAGAIAQLAQNILSGEITPSGALTTLRTFLQSLAGSITPAGALAKSVSKSLSGAITPAGALFKSISKFVGGAITAAGSLLNNFLSGEVPTPASITISDRAVTLATAIDAGVTLATATDARVTIATVSDSLGDA
jgi:hypothetical protein